jgi:hypothetical protein
MDYYRGVYSGQIPDPRVRGYSLDQERGHYGMPHLPSQPTSARTLPSSYAPAQARSDAIS